MDIQSHVNTYNLTSSLIESWTSVCAEVCLTYYFSFLYFQVRIIKCQNNIFNDDISVETLCSSAPSLFHIQRSNARPDPCCEDSNLRTCQRVNVDQKTLASENDISILGKEYQFSNFIEPSSYAYKTANGDEAVITLNQETGNMFASVKTDDGKSYGIERCHTGHVWKEFDMDSFGADEVVTLPPTSKQNVRRTTAADNTTIVTYTVMFYYTPEVATTTYDIPGFIDQIIAETNQGYINSMMPVRVAKFCTEEASFNDIEDSSDALKAFRVMKKEPGMGSNKAVRALRNTADAAALIQWSLSGCGIAYTDTWDNGYTISVTKKSCATGYFSFGHELGHNFGALHDPDNSDNNYYTYGHAHLIEQGSASTGYRTILAYNAYNHYTRVNYYSNPDVTYPITGTPTGVAGLSNNAAVITKNRFAFAAVGDESAVCGDGQQTTDSTSTTTTTSPNCNCIFPFIHNGRQHDVCTSAPMGPWCATEVDSSGVVTSSEYCSDTCPGTSEATTQQMNVAPRNQEGSCCKFQL